MDAPLIKNVHGCDVLGRNPMLGGNPTDCGRNATKVSMLTDATSTPLALTTFHR